jgi:transposase-like protein
MGSKNFKITRTQKGQQVMQMTDDQAREHLEKLLWPNGPICRHCGSVNAYKMQGKSIRPGLHRCRDCKKQFTVTVGTIFEDSHLPLAIWIKAFHLMASSKKGISALQLQRNLGIGSYKTAWHLAHRIRLAMKCNPFAGLLKDEVQVDETYVGPSRAGKNLRSDPNKPRKRGRGTTTKTPVMVLVETDGKAHSQPMQRLDSASLKSAMEACIDPSARIVTDELRSYPRAAAGFTGGHFTVKHSDGEYVSEDGLNTNTAESFFSLLKRGVYGTFHHVSKKHLHRYCSEFDFRWNGRKITDAERRTLALKQVEGKRLMYRQPINPPTVPPGPGEQPLFPF